MPLQDYNPQNTIRSYINSLKLKQSKLGDSSNEPFVVMEELQLPNSENIYFKIKFTDLRMDEHILQFTPSPTSTLGYLEVTTNGELNLLDFDFKPKNCNIYFTFEKDKINKNFDEELIVRKEHPCNGLVKFGLFAVAATTAYIFRSGIIQAIQNDLSNI